jgi:ubiquinone/menaquinone biosynthesis C-methylase UbiE
MLNNTLAVVHEFLRRHVAPGAVCIDATAGRGRDTALLCRLAGPTGRVLAFDIQPEAIHATRDLLELEGLSAQVIQDSHAHMERYAEPESVDAVVFNFGRLPGGDPRIFTQAETSLAAVDAGLRLLRPGGVMAMALYYGGENGYEERDALLGHLRQLDSRAFTVLTCDWANRPNDPPMPVFLWKERGAPSNCERSYL